jgi:DNA-binding transcriptional LysR family regulator
MTVNFRTLDLNLLRVFDAVMAEGSLTRAAAALAMTQPAVSHALRRLREFSGEELFVRVAYGVRPTPRAEALWPQVRLALATLRQALAPEDFDPQRDAAQLRLATDDATAALLAPPLVARIENEAALVHLRLTPLATRDPRRLIEQGDTDLAVGFFPELVATIVAEGRDSHLRQQLLYDTRYLCVMRRGHPLAERELTLEAYLQAHHVAVSFSGRLQTFVDQALTALGQQRRVVLTVNQFLTAGRVAAQSDLLTVLPERFVEATGRGAELVTRPLPFALRTVRVTMVWHLRNDANPAQRWLRERVLQVA